jgi:hypothetical protein
VGEEEQNVVSLSGQPIYRYPEGPSDWAPPQGEMCLEQISDHIEKHIGKVDSVFHEIISDAVHIDVHHVPPTPERPFHTLVTSGMSDLPMNVPEEADAPRHLELMVTLPENWQVSQEAFEDECFYWPVRMLKFLARFPHKYNTWLGWGHTIPNGDPPNGYAPNTQLCGAIILPSLHTPADFFTLEIDPKKTIHFFSVVPLYEEEMNLKLRSGSDALLDRFDRHGINDLISLNRKNVAKKRFGLF